MRRARESVRMLLGGTLGEVSWQSGSGHAWDE